MYIRTIGIHPASAWALPHPIVRAPAARRAAAAAAAPRSGAAQPARAGSGGQAQNLSYVNSITKLN